MIKKGQAAMEFLMTYGWAILVVLAAIAALAYFGVLDPGKLLPERCSFPAGTDCTDKASIGSNTVTIAFKNSLGHTIQITPGVTLASLTKDCNLATESANNINSVIVTPEGSSSTTYTSGTVNISNGDAFTIEFDCNYGSSKKVSSTITFYVVNPDNALSQRVVGDIRARAQ
ncbi:MAG: hypothetical protein QXG00_05260 [Candidatus Woesearchaeota archaeon]